MKAANKILVALSSEQSEWLRANKEKTSISLTTQIKVLIQDRIDKDKKNVKS